MKKAQTPEEIQTINQPINHNSVKALRHLLNALQALQETESATSTACLVGRFAWDGIKVELDRLWDGAA
jgi:hypothetical protein